MTDLDLTKACAEAMGIPVKTSLAGGGVIDQRRAHLGEFPYYDPLHDDAQAMALVKRFNLSVNGSDDGSRWEVIYFRPDSEDEIRVEGDNLNHALVETVAALHLAKLKERL